VAWAGRPSATAAASRSCTGDRRFALTLTFTFEGDRITEYGVIADPERLELLDIAVLN
jgi:hypothetical protein